MVARDYVSSKLFSLFGVVPLGIYVVAHLWTGMHTLLGPAAYDARLAVWRDIPLREVWEILILGLPLFVHTVVGIQKLLRAKPNVQQYGYFRNLKYTLQRASGAGLALFLGAHLWLSTLMPRYVEGHAATFQYMSFHMHHGLTATVYILGVLGIAFHLANGLWSFCVSWGIAVSPRGQRIAERASLVFFFVLLAMGSLTLAGLFMHGTPLSAR